MAFNDYLSRVYQRFSSYSNVLVGRFYATQFYEEKFQVKWLATKLKMFSYVSYLPVINEQDIIEFSDVCLADALQKYKGLPRGFQSGVGSFCVLASEYIDPRAIAYVQQRPKKHYAAFEMPIIYDLTRNMLFYYDKTPMWGAIYYKFFREYIVTNFS